MTKSQIPKTNSNEQEREGLRSDEQGARGQLLLLSLIALAFCSCYFVGIWGLGFGGWDLGFFFFIGIFYAYKLDITK